MPRVQQRPAELPRLVSVAGRPPPTDLAAERAVLSACMIDASRLDIAHAIIQRRDFYDERHQVIWSALLELRAAAVPIDVVTLAAQLRDHVIVDEKGETRNRLAVAGGVAYLGHLIDETPAVSHLEAHARIVHDCATRRRVISTAQLVAAEGYGEVEPHWEVGAATRLAEAAEVENRNRGAIFETWRTWSREMLDTPPAPQPWLLRHPTKDGVECAPLCGDGLLPLGKVGLLTSEGGTGKTYAMVQLAVSVATGRRWLGHFDVATEARRGRVCIAMAEEGEGDWHRRVYPTVEALGLDAREKDLVHQRVQPLPLMGKNVALLAPNADGILTETAEYHALRSRLRNDAVRHHPNCRKSQDPRLRIPCLDACMPGWSLIIIDPLARWAGPETEKDNHAATRFIQLMEALTDVPGNPTVIVVHHSSKDARKQGKADARGVGGITDAARWHATMRADHGDVLFAQQKSNYSIPMVQDLRLRRGRGGVLRVPSAEEERETEAREEDRLAEREARREDAFERRVERIQHELLEAIRSSVSPPRSRKDLEALVGGNRLAKVTAVSRLLADGRVTGGGKIGFSVAPPGSVLTPAFPRFQEVPSGSGGSKTGSRSRSGGASSIGPSSDPQPGGGELDGPSKDPYGDQLEF